MTSSQLAAEGDAGRNNAEALRATAHPLSGTARDYDPLLELIGAARFVLLGAGTHGTPEFYRSPSKELARRADK